MTRWMHCNSGESRSGWAANTMRERDRKREHPLAHRHPRDDAVDQVRSGLRHAPRPAGGAKPAPLTGEGHQLLMRALQAQKAVGEDAAFEKGIELIFDEVGQARAGLSLHLC